MAPLRILVTGGINPKSDKRSEHLESRIETGETLREGSVPVTEFRAAVIVGSGSLSFELIRFPGDVEGVTAPR